uniref:Uncharacterized protein n=1 Tax=Oryza rufipogon TaxID=4529 RepID=A0A0E0RI79_ORYRU
MAKSILLCALLLPDWYPKESPSLWGWPDGRCPRRQPSSHIHRSRAVVTDICRQGGLENLQHFVGSTLICFIGVVLLVGFVHA